MVAINKIFRNIILPLCLAILINIIVDVFYVKYAFKIKISLTTFGLIGLFLFISTYIKYSLNKIIVYSWFYFYLCAILFLNSAATLDSKLINISNEDADNFYFLNLICLSIGFLFSESFFLKRFKKISVDRTAKINSLIFVFLLTYPFVFFVSTFLSLGFIPMLSGTGIVENMYSYKYGFFYSYKYYIVISILMVAFLSFQKKYRNYCLVLAIIYALFTLIDGKRAVLLAALISGAIIYYLYMDKFGKVNFKLIAIVLFLTFLMYVGLSILRSGRGNELVSINSIILKFPVGVEYADYVYSFERLTANSVKGYDFFMSSFGAFFNSTLLEIIGFDKQKMVQSGSAYIWMKVYGIDLGIRTGIVSELYFDYGYYTFIIVFFMAFYFDYINRKIYEVKDLINFFLLVSLYGFNILLIVGQATVYFGTLTLILYLFFLNKIVNSLFKKQIIKNVDII